MKNTYDKASDTVTNEVGLPDEFEKKIGYRFINRNHLIIALTHSSYMNGEKGSHGENNERLEFLGDSVLNLAVSRKIYCESTDMNEGQMSKARASIVCKPSLAKSAAALDLGRYMKMDKGAEITGGRKRSSTIADCYEALIGAIYIDGGFENAFSFIERTLDMDNGIFIDYKSRLQEYVQKHKKTVITYEIIEVSGPDHDKSFMSQALIGNDIIGKGQGRSKKEAEQNAAKAAFDDMKKNDTAKRKG